MEHRLLTNKTTNVDALNAAPLFLRNFQRGCFVVVDSVDVTDSPSPNELSSKSMTLLSVDATVFSMVVVIVGVDVKAVAVDVVGVVAVVVDVVGVVEVVVVVVVLVVLVVEGVVVVMLYS